jgi:acyl carrier protein
MKHDTQQIKNDIKTFIAEHFLNNSANDLKDDTPLISGGLIDSISTMQLVAFLEKKYHFEFQAHEVDRDNLDSINVIADFVVSKIGG